jgi:ATP-binding cassette subfamily C protein CydC
LIALELVAFLRSPLRFAERMSTHRLGFAAVSRWRRWLMVSVGEWPYSRWQLNAAGDILDRSLADTEVLQDLWLRGIIPAVATIVTMTVGDLAVLVLAPWGHWWAAALGVAAIQSVAVAVLVRRLGAQVRADRELRARRGDYVASLVAARAAAPEIERLGATDFLRRRDRDVVQRLLGAEASVRHERQRDAVVVVLAPLLALGLIGLTHPRSAGVWIVVAALIASTTFDALVALRVAVHTCVAVTGGAERLDDVAPAPRDAPAPWPHDTTIDFRDVVVARRDHTSRRVSGVITPGQRVVISGASGAGKSTLLRALAGLDDVEGSVSVGTTPLVDIPEAQVRQHVVLVPSEPGLVRGFVRDVVAMGASVDENTLVTLGRVGITANLNDEWTELSRGERQRVALVRALLRRASILLLDEPTSALGDDETSRVLSLLRDVRATIIVASHDPRVREWCDTVIELSDRDDRVDTTP